MKSVEGKKFIVPDKIISSTRTVDNASPELIQNCSHIGSSYMYMHADTYIYQNCNSSLEQVLMIHIQIMHIHENSLI